MRARTTIAAMFVIGALTLAGVSPALAQNRTELQMMADMRMLHEELQQTRLLINTLAEQIKATTARLDTLDRSLVKGFADQKLDLTEMTTSVARLGDKVSDNSVRVGQFASELSSIRTGVGLSNDMLNQILALIQPAPVTLPAGDPANPTAPTPPLPPLTGRPAGTATPPPAGAGTPQSSIAAFAQANGLYMQASYELATERLRMFATDFPNDPKAPEALYLLGMSYHNMKDFDRAIAAYREVVAKYPQSDKVPDALFYQGLQHEQKKQNAEARKLYQQVIKEHPESLARVQAEQRLQRIGGFD